MKTAIFIDGGFYRRRAQTIHGDISAEERAQELVSYCRRHISSKKNNGEAELYRIFYYDCPPMEKKVFHPFLKKQIDFSKTDLYTWSNAFLNELKKKRKFALRLGKLADAQAHYSIRPQILKKLCSGQIKFEDLTEKDFQICVDQKGVDGLRSCDNAYLPNQQGKPKRTVKSE
jgi:hypothetical protein